MFRSFVHGFAWSLVAAIIAHGASQALAQTRLNDVEMSDEQEEKAEEIETDRDSFTPAASVVGAHRLQLESAYSFIDNRRVPETHSAPELVVRYGLADFLEMRVGGNYEIGGAGNPISANIPDNFAEEPELEEEANVSYGMKLWLTEQRGLRPASALLVNAFTPIAGEASDTHVAAGFIWGWTFSNNWTWDSAIRYSTGSLEEDRFNVWSPSSVLKIPIDERWKAHVEYFGVFSDGREHESAQHFLSPGVHYLITSNWEFGVRFGWGLNEQSPNSFVNVGGGYRF